MVHLASVPNDSAVNSPLVDGMENIKLEQPSESDVTESVYGSRFAAEALPLHEMPEQEMPKEIAYRMIKDDLSLDGNPMLNLASFVTTYMVSQEVSLKLTSSIDPRTGRRGRKTHDGSSTQKFH